MVWDTSSRVGHKIKPRTPLLLRLAFILDSSTRWMSGRQYAAVLPEPVLARTSKSRPSMASGMHCACTAPGLATRNAAGEPFPAHLDQGGVHEAQLGHRLSQPHVKPCARRAAE